MEMLLLKPARGKGMNDIRKAGCVLLLFAIFTATITSVYGECAACNNARSQQDVLNNEWAVFLGNTNTTNEVMSSTGGLVNPQYSRRNNPRLQVENSEASSDKENLNAKKVPDQNVLSNREASNSQIDPERSQSFASVLVPLENVNISGIILDISPNSTEYIPGAINIPYTKFLNPGGALKPVSELARVLGDAGISQDDDVLIYGECQPCGGGPSAATYVYWIMKYLGHKDVKLLDGGIDDWVKALQPTAMKPDILAAKSYTPELNANLLATYEYMQSKTAQIVDGRTTEEFNAGSIPSAVNIPYDNVLDGKKIKDEASLQKLFSSLQKDQPVVVYTNTGVKASMVWLPLTLLGYDARLYSWQDWDANQPKLNIAIKDATAQPTQAKIGDVVQITIVFEEINKSRTGVKENNEGNETVLTIKGCATCGFGSPQGYADLSSSDGVVKIGSTSQAQKSAKDSDFKVQAFVKDSTGAQVSKIVMKRISGDQFAGIWNANVAAGVYRVDILASLKDVSKTFNDALNIEVVGTSNYKNIGN
jgi:thiosulfate/3-mercaptopyruvate sulfurtransferase